ncbi:MAG: glycosyltransferase family 4 protein, partial [Nitrospiraceae bacterium]
LPPIDQVPNGIELSDHDAQRDAARRQIREALVKRPFILHLARVAPGKQQTLAVDGVARLRDVLVNHGLTYVIVGDGKSTEEVRQLISRHRLEPIVKMLGARTGLEKAWLLDQAAFMVSTSREEGFGNVVIEAMASGLPMLASDIGPHRELIGDREWGMLFKSGDASDLAAKLRRMIEADPAPMRARALACREDFTIKRMVDGYEQACRRALESQRS